MQDKRNTTEQEQGGIGRSNLIEEPRSDKKEQDNVSYSDISDIDQYEGHMDHGSLGGNFNDPAITIRKGTGGREFFQDEK